MMKENTLTKPKHSVLVVDDTNLSIMVLTHVLSREYVVYAARSGKDAIKSALENLPDVILLDVMMPDMDGYTVIDELKKSEKTKNIPIIFITGLNKPGDEERGLAAGAADYITKPYSPATIRLRVQNQIAMLEHARMHEYNIMKHKLASDAMSIGLWDMDVVDTDPVNPANTFTWSDEVRRMLGYSSEADFPNILHSWSNRIHPEDKVRVLNAFAAHMNDRSGKIPYDIEYRMKLKNGNYRYFHAIGTTLRDSVGTPIRVAGAVRDITEKRQLAELISYREKMLTALNQMAVTFLSQTKETFNYTMSDAIKPIAGVVGLNRVDIYRVIEVDSEKYMAQVYRWDHDKIGSAPILDILKALPFSQPAVARWVETFSEDGVVNIHTGIMSEDEAVFLAQFGVKSLLLTPVFKNDELWGIVAFQDNIKVRSFDEDTIENLRSASLLWASAHIRNEIEKQIDDFIVTQRDERQQFEAASHWYKSLLDAVPLIISATDAEMNWTFINKMAEDSLGAKREDIMGKPCNGWDLHICQTDNCAVSRAKRGLKRTYITHQGLSYQVDIEFLRDLDGEVSGFIKVMQDITETQRLAQERAEAEKESRLKSETIAYANTLSTALTNITKSPTISAGFLKEAANLIAQESCRALDVHRVGIWIMLEDAKILRSVSYYDISTGQYAVQDDFDLSDRENYFNFLVSERLIIANDRETVDTKLNLADGYGPNLCAVLDAPIRIDGKLAGVVCVEQDYCEQYPENREWTLEEQNFAASLADLMSLAISSAERREARDMAEKASKAKSAFLAMMSHEIRTPMNAIWGITEILMQSGAISEDMTDGLNRIHNSCGQLLGIINDILDFSKIEADKLDVKPAKYQVASLIHDSAQMNVMRIEGKPIEFEIYIDENIPATLIGDDLRIKQILSNILSNAFKYTNNGTVALSAAFEPNKDDGVTLVFKVQDTGCGMTEDQIEKLFDAYSRFTKENDGTIEGTGLGLSITYRLINLMGGEIHVESEPDKGSVFTVLLPQGTVDGDVLGRELANNLQQFRSHGVTHYKRVQIVHDLMPYGNVLIVDDMETNIYVAVRLLKSYGLQVDTAMSGYEAIEKIQSGRVYDVIFMDHMMPKMDGIETTKNIRELGYTHPVVALTANAVSGQADVFLQNGFDAFVSKPIDVRQLDSVLNKFVRDKQSADVLEAARQQQSSPSEAESAEESSRMQALLVQSVLKDVRKAIATLEGIFQNHSLETDEGLRSYTITVHGIKSSLANIGESGLSEWASKLERVSRERGFDIIASMTPGFLADLHIFLERLEAQSVQGQVEGEDADVEDLRSKLQSIRELCEDYDRRGALAVLDGVERCSPETRRILDSIREHVIHSEFDEAAGVAAAYAAGLGES
ncbi:MAG: response regulator [Planctomycetaceae bacterium]|nr:response regulator [Planctomycetaceae bacterium]